MISGVLIVGGNFTKKSGDPFSLRSTDPGASNVIWTKSLSRNPYKLTFFDSFVTRGQGTHVNVTPNGTLIISSLNILDQGYFIRYVVDSQGCAKKTNYQLEIEQSEAEGG